jgi:hypothetical protein
MVKYLDYKNQMLRKIILGITVFALISVSVQAGVGILEASEQAGFEISCPEGVPNCSAKTDEAASYSDTGTQNFILKLLGGLLNFAALAGVLMLVIASVRLVVAMGNQEDLQAAKKHILWSLGGLAVIILSLLIVKNVTEKVYEAAEDCLSVAEDGVYGDKIEQAEGEAPVLAASWCRENWQKEDEVFDEKILGFQQDFNLLECGGAESNWLRVDAASADGGCGAEEEETCDPAPTSMKIPASCYEGELEAQSKVPGCEALEDLIPICEAMGISADCKVSEVQKKLGATPDGTGRAADNYYYEPDSDPKVQLADSCSKRDNLYGQCTKKALDNYFKETSCPDWEWTDEEQ